MTLFSGNVYQDTLIRKNLAQVALKIEKKGDQYRFLYTHSRMESFAFKEAVNRNFDISINYLALFAMQGLSDTDHPQLVYFDSFNLIEMDCANQ